MDLAGVVYGQGGINVEGGPSKAVGGGAVQLSAINTYTGPTMIDGAPSGGVQGTLLISGLGSIAASSVVENNGLFDIARAWAPVSITT